MSSKPKKSRAGKEEPKAARVPPPRPAGKTPVALVTARHVTGVVPREGRGFSAGELEGAGIPSRLASRWGVRLDIRRRSVIQGNVDSLKNWGSHLSAVRRPEGRAKVVEEEAEKAGKKVKQGAAKAGREIKRGAEEMEKEAAEAEEDVKEEAVKVEKAVRRKASRAKPKRKSKPEG